MLRPGSLIPPFEVALIGGSTISGRDEEVWTTERLADAAVTVIDVYRGLHCPRCRAHLEELAAHAAAFEDAGARLLAVSMDDGERSREASRSWNLGGLPLAYGLSESDAAALGLFLSETIREGEPAVFAEPAVLFALSDGTLYGALYATFPFARPSAADLLEVVQVRAARNYPPRGDRRPTTGEAASA